jgi:hypothetical protein
MNLRVVTVLVLVTISTTAPAWADLISPDSPPPPNSAPADKAPPVKPKGGCAPSTDDSLWRILAPLALAALVPLVLRRSKRGTLVQCEGSSEQQS